MGYFDDDAKNKMLNALALDRVRLHSGNPGADGTANQVGTLMPATFSAASGGSRALASQVDFTGLTASQSVTWFSAWDNNGGSPVFEGADDIDSGDVTANADGEYSLKVGTSVGITDPA